MGHALALAALSGFVGLFYLDYLTGTGFIWEDALRWYYPVVNRFCSAMAGGRFPFWLDAIQNGMPLYTDIQAAFCYPLLWLLVPFARDGGLPFIVYQWFIVLHILMGGTFMYLFLVRHELRALASLLGALVFCFGGFMSLHVVHVPMLQVCAWLPLEFLLVEKCVASGRARHYGMLTAVLLVAFLAGFPQVMLYNCLLLIAYWFYQAYCAAAGEPAAGRAAIARRLGWEALRIGGVFASVLLLGAVQILPGLEHWSWSQRETWGYDRISDQSLPWHYLIHFVVPNFFGILNDARSGVEFWGYDLSVREAATYKCAPWQYFEFGAYAGQLAVVALVGLALKWRESRRSGAAFFVGGWLVALWFMLGRYGGLFALLYHVVPGVSLFRGPARMACVLDFCAAVMVAFFVASWTEKSSARTGRPLLVILGLYFAGVLLYLDSGREFFPGLQRVDCARFAGQQIIVAMSLFGGIAVCLWGLRGTGPRWRQTGFGLGLAVLTFADLHLAHGHFHRGRRSPQAYFNNNPPALRAVERMASATGPMRVTQVVNGAEQGEYLWDQNTALMHDSLESPRGYTTFNLRTSRQFKGAQNQETRFDIQNVRLAFNLNPATHQVSLTVRTNCLPRVKFYGSIRSYGSDEAILRDLDSGAIDHHNCLATIATEGGGSGGLGVSDPAGSTGSATLTRVSPECSKIKYDAGGPGVIFLSRSFYPGWEAAGSDGRSYRVIRAFIAFTGIVIPEAGSGEITLRFRPASFRLGATISGVTTLVLAGIYGLTTLRQPHGPLRIP